MAPGSRPDPWHGFVGYVGTACAMQAADACCSSRAGPRSAPDTWRRVVNLFIQCLEAPARGPLPASSPDDLHRPQRLRLDRLPRPGRLAGTSGPLDGLRTRDECGRYVTSP